MSEGSFSTKRRGPVIKTREVYEAEGWPKTCLGCGKKTRPAHCLAKDWPGTVASENQEGQCPKCALGHGRYVGVGRAPNTAKRTEAEEAEVIRLARQALADMWADRRRRGVDPDGIFFAGEKPIRHTLATLPGDDEPISEHAEEGAPLGYCHNGHPYTKRDSLGYRRCDTCMQEAARALHAKRQADKEAGISWSKRQVITDGSLGNCRKGHPYTRQSASGGKHCNVCENETKKRQRAAKRAAKLAGLGQDELAS